MYLDSEIDLLDNSHLFGFHIFRRNYSKHVGPDSDDKNLWHWKRSIQGCIGRFLGNNSHLILYKLNFQVDTLYSSKFHFRVVDPLRVSRSIESMSPKTDFTMKIPYFDYWDSNGLNHFPLGSTVWELPSGHENTVI